MARTIVQRAGFLCKPGTLFDIYLDSKKHSAATGGGAKITKNVGDAFSAWDGYITGRNLAIVPKRLIVQSWRGSDWGKAQDSTLVLLFGPAPNGERIDLIQLNVPDDQVDAIDQGWHEHYWTPWKAYLSKKR